MNVRPIFILHAARRAPSRIARFVLLGIVAACGGGEGTPLPAPGGEGPAANDARDAAASTPDAGGAAVPGPPCAPASCSGHGICADVPAGGVCTCDEGFEGPACATRNGDYGRRVKIGENLADPDVLRIDDDHFVLSGTGTSNGFTFLESSDLVTWTKGPSYDPSQKDPTADYCFVWAPDIVKSGSKLHLYFSAHRGPKGATTCPPPPGTDVATYRAVSENGSLDFGKPEPLFAGTTGPRTITASACPAQGCSRAIRIDPTEYDGRLYYVFFSGGNNIASVSLSNPNDVRLHAGPAVFGGNAFEENINEGPELFERDGHSYLFFSAAFYDSQYATFYVMGKTTAELTRERPLMRLTTPVRRKNGALVETHGHNAIATRRGEAFNFFHVGVFDGAGGLVRRDTYRQRLAWRPDGSAMSQNALRISWNALGGGNAYSVDLVLRDKSVIGPCIGAATLGQQTSATFAGICPDAGDRLVHKSEVAEIRLFASPNDGFKQVASAPYDGYSDEIVLQAKP